MPGERLPSRPIREKSSADVSPRFGTEKSRTAIAGRSLSRSHSLCYLFTNTHTLSLSLSLAFRCSRSRMKIPHLPPLRDTHFPLSGGCEACISLSHAARPGRSRSRIAPFAHAVIAPLRVPLRVPAGCRERRIRVGCRTARQFSSICVRRRCGS